MPLEWYPLKSLKAGDVIHTENPEHTARFRIVAAGPYPTAVLIGEGQEFPDEDKRTLVQIMGSFDVSRDKIVGCFTGDHIILDAPFYYVDLTSNYEPRMVWAAGLAIYRNTNKIYGEVDELLPREQLLS